MFKAAQEYFVSLLNLHWQKTDHKRKMQYIKKYSHKIKHLTTHVFFLFIQKKQGKSKKKKKKVLKKARHLNRSDGVQVCSGDRRSPVLRLKQQAGDTSHTREKGTNPERNKTNEEKNTRGGN